VFHLACVEGFHERQASLIPAYCHVGSEPSLVYLAGLNISCAYLAIVFAASSRAIFRY